MKMINELYAGETRFSSLLDLTDYLYDGTASAFTNLKFRKPKCFGDSTIIVVIF